jgi:hypothetical protein
LETDTFLLEDSDGKLKPDRVHRSCIKPVANLNVGSKRGGLWYKNRPISDNIRSQEFIEFKAAILAVVNNIEDSDHRQLEELAPIVASRMAVLEAQNVAMRNQLDAIGGTNERIANTVNNIFGVIDNAAVSYMRRRDQIMHPSVPTTLNAPVAVPVYLMKRAFQDVINLCLEWKEGVDGGPSVESLEAQFGSRWRRVEKERKYFERRKPIYRLVDGVSNTLGVPYMSAAESVESYRQSNGLTLLQLAQKFVDLGDSLITQITNA